MARKYLESEWTTLGEPQENETLWQPLCDGGAIGRLNLSPFRKRGGKLDDLLEAFLKSSRQFSGGEANLKAAWKEIGKRLKKKRLANLTYQDWKRLDRKMRAENYPAIHHSPKYTQQYNLAYRILTGDAAKKIINELKS